MYKREGNRYKDRNPMRTLNTWLSSVSDILQIMGSHQRFLNRRLSVKQFEQRERKVQFAQKPGRQPSHFSGKECPSENGVGCGQENKIMKADRTRLGGLCRREGKEEPGSLSSAGQMRVINFRHANLEVTAEFQGGDAQYRQRCWKEAWFRS